MVCADDNHKIYHYTRDGQPVNDRGELMVCADDNHNDRGELIYHYIHVTVNQSMIEVS